MVPIWAVVPSDYAPRGGRRTWQVNMRMLHRVPVENSRTGGNFFLNDVHSLSVNFWVKPHTFVQWFLFFHSVCPAWERLLLCKCWVWTPGLVPLSGAARPLGATSPSVRTRVCWITGWKAGASRWAEQKKAAAHMGRESIGWLDLLRFLASVIHMDHSPCETSFNTKKCTHAVDCCITRHTQNSCLPPSLQICNNERQARHFRSRQLRQVQAEEDRDPGEEPPAHKRKYVLSPEADAFSPVFCFDSHPSRFFP